MSGGMRVTVDRDLCCGAGQCALIAPEVFDQAEDDGLVLLLAPEPAEGSRDGVNEAAQVCPTGAITFST